MHGDFLQSPMPYIYFTSTRTPSIFTSYNTRVNKKFSHFDPHFHASQWGFAIQQGSGSALGRVSGRDSRESMVDEYSSEDNQSSGTPGPPSAVSLAGDSRESMVNHYSSEYNQNSRATLRRVSGRGQPRIDGKPVFFGV